MSETTISRRKKRKGRTAAVLCRLFGTLILLVVIAACLCVTLPGYLGYEIFHIVSGSMEPNIPVGSVIYVKKMPPQNIEKGEVIAFVSGDSVVAHRVVNNQTVEGHMTTKGDANEGEDFNEVAYDQVIGKVAFHVRALGQLLMILTTNVGKIWVICFAACGALLNIVAGRLESE